MHYDAIHSPIADCSLLARETDSDTALSSSVLTGVDSPQGECTSKKQNKGVKNEEYNIVLTVLSLCVSFAVRADS